MARVPDVPCAGCGTLIYGGRGCLPPGQATCQPCRRLRTKYPCRRLRTKYPARRCAWCAVRYQPSNRERRFCSRTCSLQYGVSLQPPPLSPEERRLRYRNRIGAKARARRLRLALTWDGITDEEILNRDRWTCGICRKRISKTYRHPHPRSPSIDHVIPLAEGGDDTAVNKRATHLVCNLRRGARGGGEQLALLSTTRDGDRATSILGQAPRPKPMPKPKPGPAIRHWTCRYCQLQGEQAGNGKSRQVCEAPECQRLRLRDNNRRHLGSILDETGALIDRRGRNRTSHRGTDN